MTIGIARAYRTLDAHLGDHPLGLMSEGIASNRRDRTQRAVRMGI